MKIKKIDVLITHKNCHDGSGSALVVKKYCEETNQRPPKIVFMQYGMKVDVTELVGQHVMIADFSFDADLCNYINHEAESLVILDHHETAKEALKDLDFAIFDMSKSGAMLTWNYLYPNEAAPDIIKYIEDRDLWLWKLSESKEFSAGFALWSQDNLMKLVDTVEAFSKEFVNSTIDEGRSILQYQNALVDKAHAKIDKVPTIVLDGLLGSCSNATHLISELGNMYSDRYAFSLQYFTTDKDMVFSLRSQDDFNVAKIAKSFGGGGHKNAAGFSIPLKEFDFNHFFTENKIRRKGLFARVINALFTTTLTQGPQSDKKGVKGPRLKLFS